MTRGLGDAHLCGAGGDGEGGGGTGGGDKMVISKTNLLRILLKFRSYRFISKVWNVNSHCNKPWSWSDGVGDDIKI